MKKRLMLLVFTLILLFALPMAVGAAQTDDTPYLELSNGIIVKTSPRYDYVNWANTEINDCIFLPSFTDMSNVKIKFQSGVTNITCNSKSIASGDRIDFSSCSSTDGQGNACYKLNIRTNVGTKTYTVYKADTLPSVFVTTSVGVDRLNFDNERDYNSKIDIINQSGTYEYAETSPLVSEIRTRGNATKGMLKKPYQIKLGTKTDLFGMGSAKTWILLANYMDQSLIRNSVMYHIGSLLGMNTSDFRAVDLFIDNEYQGAYLLCEKVQINSNRVDITDMEDLMDTLNPTYSTSLKKVTSGTLISSTILTEYQYVEGVQTPADITGGYLVELDNNYGSSEPCYFKTKVGNGKENLYVIKSPEYCSKEQVEYIARIFANMEEAMASSTGKNRLGEHYTEYIDIDTLASAYIMAELGRNIDAGSSSMFYYKDTDTNGIRSTIFKGPLWDCDNTLGNIHRDGADNQEGLWAGTRFYWANLLQHDDFKAQVKENFEGVYEQIIALMDQGGYIDTLVAEMGNSVYMDRAKWDSFSTTKWPKYDVGVVYDDWQSQKGQFLAIKKYTDGVDDKSTTVLGYLMNCLETRTNWLAEYWKCDVTIRTRMVTLPKSVEDAIALLKQKLRDKAVETVAIVDEINIIKNCDTTIQRDNISNILKRYTIISTAVDYKKKSQ